MVQNFIFGTEDVVKALQPQDVTVNVPAPVVNIEPPIVNVPPAFINVQAAKMNEGTMNVRIVEDISPPKVKKVIRGAPTRQYPAGPIEGVIE